MENIDLIFANNHKFTAGVVKKIASSAGFSCYTLLDDSEYSYIFNDLRPKVFMLTEDFFNKYEKETIAKVNEVKPFVIMCSDNLKDLEFVDLYWSLHIDTFNLKESLQHVFKGLENG